MSNEKHNHTRFSVGCLLCLLEAKQEIEKDIFDLETRLAVVDRLIKETTA